MRRLYDEVLRRFPEVVPRIVDGDEELPYVVVYLVVNWLRTVATPAMDPDVVRRVVDFYRWCVAQPRGETAADDIPTIAVVGLRDSLFGHDELLPLIPHLMSRDELLRDRGYLIGRAGNDRFRSVLRLAAEIGRHRTPRRGGGIGEA